MFKGWQQETVFPGWHEEPSYRARALAELRAAVAAAPARASAQEALHLAEGFAAAENVDPAPPRDEVKALDAKLESYRSAASAPITDIFAAIEARAKAQADPAPYFTGAQILIDRGELDRAIAMAERGLAASASPACDAGAVRHAAPRVGRVLRRLARDGTVTPPRRAQGGRAQEPRRSPAAEADADHRRRPAVRHLEPSRKSSAAELFRLLVRDLSCGVAAPENGVREIPGRSERRVPADQHRRRHGAAPAVPDRDEVSVSRRARGRGRCAAGDALRQHPVDLLRRPGRRRAVSDRRQRITRRFAGARVVVHRSVEEPLTRACVSASTAYAVAASLMNLPMSVAGSRCLLRDVADHMPVVASWWLASHASPLPTCASVSGTPDCCNTSVTSPVA